MKKLFFYALAAMTLMACADDSQSTQGGGSEQSGEPSTAVYVQGTKLDKATRAMAAPYAQATADAHFYIRIDSRIPGAKDGISKEYWPQEANGASVFNNGNKGTIDLTYPYWNIGTGILGQYVYDTTGKAVNSVLLSVPTVQQMLSVNKNNAYNVNNIKTDGLKIIWYVCKYVNDGTRYAGWHVDGVLTYESTKDVTEVIPEIKDEDKDKENKADTPTLPATGKGNIEVDIHQQEHSSWDEIKTSIHVRDLVNSVTVEIPLEQAHVAESDDFAIRTYDFELESKVFINGTEYSLNDANPIRVTVEHKTDKVVITISAINKDYIEALRKEYGDGVTVEVHTYAKGLSKQDVWTRLKQSQVKVNPSTYDGEVLKHITSAFFTE